jgi:hypothetical protein
VLSESPSLRIERAISTHYEALPLVRDNPSFALIGFISVIESVAQVRKKPSRCATCDQVTDSRERFETAVAGVLDEDERDALADAYSLRSRTAHDARLVGGEDLLGMWRSSRLLAPDPALEFQFRTLRAARKASRLLLAGALDVTLTVPS